MTLTLKIVNQFFRMTHRLMIIHHHTKFGLKKKLVEQFRIYWADTIGQTYRRTEWFPYTPLSPVFIRGMGERGYKNELTGRVYRKNAKGKYFGLYPILRSREREDSESRLTRLLISRPKMLSGTTACRVPTTVYEASGEKETMSLLYQINGVVAWSTSDIMNFYGSSSQHLWWLGLITHTHTHTHTHARTHARTHTQLTLKWRQVQKTHILDVTVQPDPGKWKAPWAPQRDC